MTHPALWHYTGLGLQVLLVYVVVWALVREIIDWRAAHQWRRDYREKEGKP